MSTFFGSKVLINSYQHLRGISESENILISQKPIQKWANNEQGHCLIGARLIEELG